jgi:hypothetical protein
VRGGGSLRGGHRRFRGQRRQEIQYFEDAARQFGNILHDPEVGKQVAEFVESKSCHADLKSESNIDFVKHLTPAKLDEIISKEC